MPMKKAGIFVVTPNLAAGIFGFWGFFTTAFEKVRDAFWGQAHWPDLWTFSGDVISGLIWGSIMGGITWLACWVTMSKYPEDTLKAIEGLAYPTEEKEKTVP